MSATQYDGVEVIKVTTGHRYARNGRRDSNGQGTPIIQWRIVRNGQALFSAPRRSDCLDILDDLAAEFGWVAS